MADYPSLDSNELPQLTQEDVLAQNPNIALNQPLPSTGNPQLDLQQARQGLDTVESIAMKGTGITPSFAPISNVPTPYSGLPSTLRAPVPTPEEQFLIQAQEMEKATRDAASQNAQQVVADDQARKGMEARQKTQEQVSKVEADVKADQEKSGSNLFKGIGDAIAIMLGAYSQGFTGNKENPGLKAVEARIDREVQARKYNAEQEAALRKLAADEAQNRLEQAKFMTDNALKITQIQKYQAEMKSLGEQAKAGQDLASYVNRRELSDAEVGELQLLGKTGNEMAAQYVSHPYKDGVRVRSTSRPEDTGKLRAYMAETGAVVPDINSLLELAESPNFSRLSLSDRAKVATKINTMVGALRIPITGPGPLTEPEREFLLKTIGDPNAFFALPSVERLKLKEIRSNIQRKVKNAYKQFSGIEIGDEPGIAPSPFVQGLIDRGVKRETAEAIEAKRKSGK